MKKYSILRKLPTKLMVSAKILAGTLGVVFGANQTIVAGKTLSKDFKSPNQIEKDSQMLEANTLIMGYQPVPTDFNVLMHNGNEPIYYFVGSSYNAREKELIKEVLNYYETAFKTINPKYRFKEISTAEGTFRTSVGQTVINFQKAKTDEFFGASLNYYSLLSPTYISGSTILFNENISLEDNTKYDDGSEKQFYQTIFEEVGHTFGLGDVYFDQPHHPFLFGLNNTTEIVHTNSFIQNHQFLRTSIVEFTPIDYAMFQALYNTDHLTGKHSPQYIKSLVEEYRYNYFLSKANKVYPTLKRLRGFENLEIQPISLNKNTFTIETFDSNVNSYSGRVLTHKLKFENGLLHHTIYDNHNNLVDEGTFEYLNIDGMFFVNNAFFASSIQPGLNTKHSAGGGAFSDFVVVDTNHGPQFVNLVSINRHSPYSLKAQNYALRRFKSLNPKENRVEVIKKSLSVMSDDNQIETTTYSFTLPKEVLEEKQQPMILPDKNNFKLETNKPKRKNKKDRVF